jgi:uncharacterized membrane protein
MSIIFSFTSIILIHIKKKELKSIAKDEIKLKKSEEKFTKQPLTKNYSDMKEQINRPVWADDDGIREEFKNWDLVFVILISLLSLLFFYKDPLHKPEISSLITLLVIFSLNGYLIISCISVNNRSIILNKILGSIIIGLLLNLFLFLLWKLKLLPSFPQSILLILSLLIIPLILVAIVRRKLFQREEYIKKDIWNGNGISPEKKLEEKVSIYKEKGKEESHQSLHYNKTKKVSELQEKSPVHEKKDKNYLYLIILLMITALSCLLVLLPFPQNFLYTILSVFIVTDLLLWGFLAILYDNQDHMSLKKRFLITSVLAGVLSIMYGVLYLKGYLKPPHGYFLLILLLFNILMLLMSIVTKKRIYLTEEKVETTPSETEYPSKEYDSEKIISENKKLTKFMDLALIVFITLLTALFVLIPVLNTTPIRTILGLFLILFIPGYSLIAALFPKKSDLDGIERLALSFGLSIAISPLIGLALNYTPFGIRLDPILLSLTIFILAMSIVAYLRRRKIPENERFNVPFANYFSEIKNSFHKESRTERILSIILIISIILAISTTIFIIVKPKEGEKFTEFYILGPGGKASDYPTNLTPGQTGNIIIGIVNHEYQTTEYQLVIREGNQTFKNESLTLQKEQKIEIPFNFTSGSVGQKKMEFLLYKKPDLQNIYRELHLWIQVT